MSPFLGSAENAVSRRVAVEFSQGSTDPMDEWDFWFTRIGGAIGVLCLLALLIAMAVNAT